MSNKSPNQPNYHDDFLHYVTRRFTRARTDLSKVRTEISEIIAPEVANGSSAFITRYHKS